MSTAEFHERSGHWLLAIAAVWWLLKSFGILAVLWVLLVLAMVIG